MRLGLEQGADPGDGGAQLVAGIGDEAPLPGERRVESLEEVVEGVGQAVELVPGAGAVEATQVLAKCPSKYEMKQKAANGEKMPHAATEGMPAAPPN